MMDDHSTNIVQLKNTYGRYTEVLPEELSLTAIEEDLKACEKALIPIFDKDHTAIEAMLKNAKISINLKDFDNPSIAIRKAFPLRNENVVRSSEKIKFLLGHVSSCKHVLLTLAERIKGELEETRTNYSNYQSQPITSREKRVAFINFT